MNNQLENNVELEQLSKQNILAGLRGMWNLWCGGNLQQMALSDLNKLVAKKLYENTHAFLTQQCPELNLEQSAKDPQIIKAIWLKLSEAIKNNQFMIPFGQDKDIPLWGGADDKGRNILHYLCMKKVPDENQAQYLKELGSFFSSKSLYLSKLNEDIKPLHLEKDIDSRTPIMLLAEMIRQSPESHYNRKPILEKLAMLETSTLKETLDTYFAQDEKVYTLMTIPSYLLVDLEREPMVHILGGMGKLSGLKMNMCAEVFDIIRALDIPPVQHNVPARHAAAQQHHGFFNQNNNPLQTLLDGLAKFVMEAESKNQFRK